MFQPLLSCFQQNKAPKRILYFTFFPIWRVLISVFIICFLRQILRKKYYNMIEDMKGKIRVYCRARPLSRSELERVRLKVFSLLALRCYPICRGTSCSQLKAVYYRLGYSLAAMRYILFRLGENIPVTLHISEAAVFLLLTVTSGNV